jgi:hypothetical protein
MGLARSRARGDVKHWRQHLLVSRSVEDRTFRVPAKGGSQLKTLLRDLVESIKLDNTRLRAVDE